MQSINALRKSKPDDVVFLIPGSPVQHIEYAVIMDYTRVAGDKVLPTIVRIRGNDRLASIFDKFHFIAY